MKRTSLYVLMALAITLPARTGSGDTPTMPEFVEQANIRAPLAITVHADRRYRPGHPIPVKLMITNVADQPVLINGRMLVNHYRLEGELSFLITDSKGKTYSLTKIISPRRIQPDDLAVLAVGETREETVDLTEYFGLHRRGTYKVKAVYHNNLDLKKGRMQAWQGVVASEPADVVIE